MHSGGGHIAAFPVIRTASRVETLLAVINAIDDCRGRHLLLPEVAHLKIETANGQAQQWAVRVHPLGAAPPLERERHGEGDEVLGVIRQSEIVISSFPNSSGQLETGGWQPPYSPGPLERPPAGPPPDGR